MRTRVYYVPYRPYICVILYKCSIRTCRTRIILPVSGSVLRRQAGARWRICERDGAEEDIGGRVG